MSYSPRNAIQKTHRKHFDRTLLPKPLSFYQTVFPNFKLRDKWAQTFCCFHDDHHPSLSLNLETGAFNCFSCGEQGGNIIDFYQRFYRVAFKTAAKALGAWRY